MADDFNTSSSAIVAEVLRGSHVLKVNGYSRTKELLEIGKYAASIPFSVGGHRWVIRYYPNGDRMEDADSISVFLFLDSDAYNVRTEFSFNLLDKDGVPSTLDDFIYGSSSTFIMQNDGYGYDIKRAALESSVYLRNDCFTIKCNLTVTTGIRTEQTKYEPFVMVPPSDLHQHFGDLLKDMDGSDVTFKVGEETFFAHRCVLAARSSVFKAKLFGSMKETTHADVPITICDMEGEVFKSLLHFLYTDSLPKIAEEEESNGLCASLVMAQHLLVAADRYNVGRLKLLCEEELCKRMDSSMVATSLALAEQHSCRGLKQACLNFLSSPSNLRAMLASDGFEHLRKSCPSVLKELISRFMPPELKTVTEIIMAI